MVPATRSTIQPILADLTPLCSKVLLVGDLRRGEDNPSERADILCVPDPAKLEALKEYVNNSLGKVTQGRVGPNGELSHPFPSSFVKVTGRIKACLWFVAPGDFGLMAFALTGPPFWVQRAMDYYSKISNGGAHSGGALIDNSGNRLDTDTEEKVFELLKTKWIPPERRK